VFNLQPQYRRLPSVAQSPCLSIPALGNELAPAVITDSVPGEEGVSGFADVVDSDHVGALGGDGDSDSDGSEGSFFDGTAEDFGEESLSGVSDQDGAVEGSQRFDVRKQVDVVLGGFSEADAGVSDDSFASDAGLFEHVEACGKELADVADHVVVMRIGLHGLRRAENVHADYATV
jgi:hypothetical protein